MKLLLQAGAITLAMLGAPTANAACTQTDLRGTWGSYIAGMDVSTYWLACTLKIDGTGRFTAAGSSCAASSGLKSAAEGTFHMVNGALCQFDGGIELTKGTAENFIRHATLGIDKNSAQGVGGFEGSNFSFNLVRIK